MLVRGLSRLTVREQPTSLGELHSLQEHLETRIAADWIEKAICFDWHQQLIALVHCAIEPFECDVYFFQSEMNPSEAAGRNESSLRFFVQPLKYIPCFTCLATAGKDQAQPAKHHS